MKKNIIVLDTKWYGSKVTLDNDIAQAWAVLVYDVTIKKFKAFLWVWIYGDEEIDTEDIIDRWNKLTWYEALGIFGNVEYNEQRLIDWENFSF